MNQGFSYYFFMMIKGSGSIPLTIGSRSGRPKNMWIRWIRIRNTGFYLWYCLRSYHTVYELVHIGTGMYRSVLWIRITLMQIRIRKCSNRLIFHTYVLACHLQIDADTDPVLDPAYHFGADPDADPGYQNDADPDPQHWYRHCKNSVQVYVWI